ncbi:MAG: glycosyltransferase N-terminal domain-containing protein, partial [Phycisphaerales bacterium]
MVDRFLDRVRPDLVALCELELWPNFVSACAQRGIPVVVVNARQSVCSLPARCMRHA